MRSPYGLEVFESCRACKRRHKETLCDLPMPALQEFEKHALPTTYPPGAVLFVEGQRPRGVFVLCQGRVKLSISSRQGKTFILKVAQPGEVLGLGATVSGKPYELAAETVEPCLVSFVKRSDFLRLMAEHSEACFRVAELLSEKYNQTFQEIRALGLSHSAAKKLAVLLLDWSSGNGQAAQEQPRLTRVMTHEEIGQKVGTSRETVTRVFAEFRKRQIIASNGATLVIRNKGALRSIAAV